MDSKNTSNLIIKRLFDPKPAQNGSGNATIIRIMRKILLIALSVLALSSCATNRAYWRTCSPEAAEEAKETGKPLLVLVSAPDCAACESNWCRIFSRKEFLKEVSKDCVPLLLNCPYEEPSPQCSEFREKYDAGLSPSLLLIEGSGEKIATVPFPYQDTKSCLESIRALLAK